MNRQHLSRIIGAFVIAIIAFSVGYIMRPQAVQAPVSAEKAPFGATTVPMTIVSLRETRPGAPTVTVEYPQFPSASPAFNDAIASSTLSRLADFRSMVTQNDAARRATAPAGSHDAIPLEDYSFTASWNADQINPAYLSIVMRFDAYVGGANESQDIETFNYDFAHASTMQLGDLFSDKNYLDALSKEARSQLVDALSTASNGNAPADMITAGTAPAPENFKDFTFNDYQITLYFPKYAVAPGSFGEQIVRIPRKK